MHIGVPIFKGKIAFHGYRVLNSFTHTLSPDTFIRRQPGRQDIYQEESCQRSLSACSFPPTWVAGMAPPAS